MSNILQTLLDTYQQNPAAALALIPGLGQAVEDGKIIELPCKVGDTFWTIAYTDNRRVIQVRAVEIYLQGIINIIWIENVNKPTDFWKLELKDWIIGKTVFLTREEAEQALKEREKND